MGPPSPTGTVENAGCVASTRSATVTSARRPEIGITISRAVSSWLSLVCPTPVSAAACGRRPHAELGGPDLDDLTLRAWRRHRQTVLLQPGNVKLDGLADQPQHLRPGFAYGYTPWEVRHVGSPTRRSPFHHDHIARHSPLPAFLRPGVANDALYGRGGTGSDELGNPRAGPPRVYSRRRNPGGGAAADPRGHRASHCRAEGGRFAGAGAKLGG